MFKKVVQFITSTIQLIKLKQYKSFLRKVTFQYRFHNWKQARAYKLKIYNLSRYKRWLSDGVCLKRQNKEELHLFNKLSIINNDMANIIFTDDLSFVKPNHKLVIFFDLDNGENQVSNIMSKVDFILSNTLDKYDGFPIERVFYYNELSGNFYIGRFLLAIDFISFEQFMLYCDEIDPFVNSNKICLSLPEYKTRFDYIKKLIASDGLKDFNFVQVIGLRHTIGWVGCGLSYKYLFIKALQHDFSNITVAEDDILLEDNFINNYRFIQSYLSTTSNWGVFNGYTFWQKNSDITYVCTNDEVKLYRTHNFMSMVFNIYNKYSIEIGSKWDDSCREQENAIDGYLNSNIQNIVTSWPFIVNHNDKLDSVLWNNSNEFIYSHMIAENNVVNKNASEKM